MSLGRVLGGALLVAGTCIGAGMIGLPVATAAGGFNATLIAFLIIWALMTMTAYCMLEVSLWFPGETNLISMAKATLGPWAAHAAWFVYLCFMYAVMAAYTAGGSVLSAEALNAVGFALPSKHAGLGFVLVFAAIVFLGTRAVDWLNRLFMIGLCAAYAALMASVSVHVEPEHLKAGEGIYLLAAVPLMVTAFGFHLLIPSLTTYFKHDIKGLRWAIFIGGLMPLIVYLSWEVLILGTIPKMQLLEIAHNGDAVTGVTQALNQLLGNSAFTLFAKGFTLFALLSSFIGVALGLFDFLSDGVGCQKTPKNRVGLLALTFLPPYLFARFYPEGFLLALSYAGVFGAILLVLYPALMVWVGRKRRMNAEYRFCAGKLGLALCVVFGLLVVILQLLAQSHLLPTPA